MSRAQKVLLVVSIGLIIAVVLVAAYTGDVAVKKPPVELIDKHAFSASLGPGIKTPGVLLIRNGNFWTSSFKGTTPTGTKRVFGHGSGTGKDQGEQAASDSMSARLSASKNGVFYAGTRYQASILYDGVYAINLAEGKSVKLADLNEDYGSIVSLAVSPDGKSLAVTTSNSLDVGNPFVAMFRSAGSSGQKYKITIIDSARHTSRIVNDKLSDNVGPLFVLCWHEDGLIVTGAEAVSESRGRQNLYRIDPESGAANLIYRGRLSDNNEQGFYFSAQPLVYLMSQSGHFATYFAAGQLHVINLKTGEVKTALLPDDTKTGQPINIEESHYAWADKEDRLVIYADNATVDKTEADSFRPKLYEYDASADSVKVLTTLLFATSELDYKMQVLSWSPSRRIAIISLPAIKDGSTGGLISSDVSNKLYFISINNGQYAEIPGLSGDFNFIGWL